MTKKGTEESLRLQKAVRAKMKQCFFDRGDLFQDRPAQSTRIPFCMASRGLKC